METKERLLEEFMDAVKFHRDRIIQNENMDKKEAIETMLHILFCMFDGVSGSYDHAIDLIVRKTSEEDIKFLKKNSEEEKIIHEDIVLNDLVHLHSSL